MSIKLNLESNGDFRHGYLNIVSKPIGVSDKHEGVEVIPGQFWNLDPVVKDESVDEIVFNPMLNIMNPEQMVQVVNHWTKKLKNEGKLYCWFIDHREVARMMYMDYIGLADAHRYFIGNNREIQTLSDCDTVVRSFKSAGYIINDISLNNHVASLELTKCS